MSNWKKYRKLIVAIIGVALLAGNEVLGLELGFTADQIYNGVVAVLTATGVYAASNEA